MLMASTVDSATVILIGTTGHGKSLLANRLLQLTPNDNTTFNFRVNEGQNPETTESEVYTATLDKFELTVIDTPGFFDSEDEIRHRWIDVVKAFLLVGGHIDAVIFVANSRDLFNAAKCFESIRDCIDGLNLNRVIVVFTRVETINAEIFENKLEQFNSFLKRGTLGMQFIFSDQRAEDNVLQQNLSEIIEKIKIIKGRSIAPITRECFTNYTRTYLSSFLQKEAQSIRSLGDLNNSPLINMTVVRNIISTEEIENIWEQRPRTSSCFIL